MTLEIRLLGDFSLYYDGVELYDVHRTRLRSFLAYLALYAITPLSRRQVAFTFWPDSSEGQARNNLRKLLYDLRQALPPLDSLLRIDAHTIHWISETSIRLDVAAFDALVEQADSTDPSKPAVERALLDKAISLYDGELLPSCYDEWIVPERERLRQAYLGTLDRLMLLVEESEDYSSAVAYANQQLIYDPLRESTYRRLMRFYAFLGDGASALRVYHACVSRLEEELGVEPGPETEEAYARVMDNDTPAVLSDRPLRQARGARMMGREREWWTMLEAWDKAAAGTLHLCLILGEAGIGKSRLAQELLRWVSERGLTALYSKAYEQAGALAYTPVIDWLQTPPLQTAIRSLDDSRVLEIARLLPDLLSERPDLPRPEPISERWQRQRLFDALTRAILACRQPLLLVLDDGQWCDPDTLAWLHYLLEQSTKKTDHPPPAILLVCTARPEEMDEGHPLPALAQAFRMTEALTELDLPHLSAEQTVQLAATLQPAALDAQSGRDLYAFTKGNPLFIVETLADEQWRLGVQAALPDLAAQMAIPQPGALPPKLYAVIHARLTQLTPDARHLAALAAVIGRAFSFDLLQQSGGLDEYAAMLGVDELWRRGIVREQADGRYDFSHDRIRDVAYAEISPVQRPLLHRRVALALEARHEEIPGNVSAQLGVHYERAGDQQNALNHYERAAKASADLFAYQEAAIFLDKVLAFLERAPDTDDIRRRRIDRLLDRQRLFVALKGVTAPERQELLSLAALLSQKLDDPHLHFRIAAKRCRSLMPIGNWYMVEEVLHELVLLAQRMQVQSYLDEVTVILGVVSFFRGNLQTALDQFARIKNPADLQKHPLDYTSQAHIFWLAGYPERARNRVFDALQRYESLDDPPLQITVREATLYPMLYLGDTTHVRHRTRELRELCATYGYPAHDLVGYFMEGWLMTQAGNPTEGLAQMHYVNRISEELRILVYFPYLLTITAQAQGQAGQAAGALETLMQAKESSHQLGDHSRLAEIHRLTGEMQQRLGHEDAVVEASLSQALETARQQGAKSLELRAAMSMARFWHSQGKTAQAHELLSGIYGWFTEGFDTPDLQMARALLTELSHTSS